MEPILKTLFLVLTIAAAPAPVTIVAEIEADMCRQNERDYWGGMALGAERGRWFVRNDAGEAYEITDLKCVEELEERIGAGS